MNSPKCPIEKTDCAASHDGFCAALVDANFGSKPCPFYRSRKDQKQINKNIMEDLRERKRLDLIKKYHAKNM